MLRTQVRTVSVAPRAESPHGKKSRRSQQHQGSAESQRQESRTGAIQSTYGRPQQAAATGPYTQEARTGSGLTDGPPKKPARRTNEPTRAEGGHGRFSPGKRTRRVGRILPKWELRAESRKLTTGTGNGMSVSRGKTIVGQPHALRMCCAGPEVYASTLDPDMILTLRLIVFAF